MHDKDHTAAWTQIVESCSGKPLICHPIPIYHPESWSLDVYASADDHGWVDVSERVYDSIEIGDYYQKDAKP